ncbi:hypothetical protein Galf_2134 [Gallionella capsiferriformans ES-2]|uniref:Uncharacterized protein n=1 Tax=Gallionella capsiferriformans (strain ES-2) TaxID=395494 RepID=D9SIH6_GALCS|nr:hypothetical protein Galf_2134 [Gallionella capsiferriformans ES-2]
MPEIKNYTFSSGRPAGVGLFLLSCAEIHCALRAR